MATNGGGDQEGMHMTVENIVPSAYSAACSGSCCDYYTYYNYHPCSCQCHCQQHIIPLSDCFPTTCPPPTTQQSQSSPSPSDQGDSETEKPPVSPTKKPPGSPDGGMDKISRNPFIIKPPVNIPVVDSPSWKDPKLYGMGFQQYIVTLGTSVTILPVLVRAMGGGNVEKSEAIQTSLLVTGINTLLQTWLGTGLPVVMGGSYSFIIPAMSIALSSNLRCDPSLNRRQRFKLSMRRMQGASIIGSISQIVIGFSGLGKVFARYLSPLASVPLVTLTGLGLFGRGFPELAKCVEIGLPALVLIVFSTQFLPRMVKCKKEMVDRFGLVSSMLVIWAYAEILTLAGAYNDAPQNTQNSCRTDRSMLVGSAPWLKFPYPFQWGIPKFEAGDALSVIAACFVDMIESTGTFIATSREAGASPIPPPVISRGIGFQGIGTLLDAIFGSGSGSNASVEQAGLVGLTQVGSRRVTQVSAVFMLFFSIFGKFGAILASIPLPIVAALRSVLFPYVASAGLGYLQFCNLNSHRSKFILGFSLFMGLSVPQYFNQYLSTSGHGPVHTSSTWFNDIMEVIFTSAPTVAITVGFFLDCTHSRKECSTWRDSGREFSKKWEKIDPDFDETYSQALDLLGNLCN